MRFVVGPALIAVMLIGASIVFARDARRASDAGLFADSLILILFAVFSFGAGSAFVFITLDAWRQL